jgi:hypothetical protein
MAVERDDHLAVGIAADEAHALAQCQELVESLPGKGPDTTSPPTKTRSGLSCAISVRTASRAGRFPWMS